MEKEKWERLKKIGPTILNIIPPVKRPKFKIKRQRLSIPVRKIARKKTRGYCLICERPTRRYDNRKHKYLCARHV